ncbi:MAG: bifunctional phosphopantothenoylcysteine decarboxylase/phosphopantothenate--cysteine ligase CoaBC [Chloroflexi bacterium]|nr:MAG: bifunctional phosphopantothenoylcysteine decarboxylase/phosphopantothenate--cysteine ligase CoaBC [Chloroflexota bacterium]TMG07186.1 MAG: bifunctional phosphopantothenoylcysteine decarboxylase/phosphopantothenate--cysteine ligase CoaBC [Chloroflexota bacterium]
MTDRNIVLGVTGSIAVYKAVDLASKLTQARAVLNTIMTPEASKFVAPITFQGVSGRRPYWDMWDANNDLAEAHIALARQAELLVIAPATATVIARLALGLAEEMVSLTALATRAPLIVCPALDSQMFEHPATQEHLDTLRSRGIQIVGPEEGRLASGQVGRGRLSEVDTIIGWIRHVLGKDGDLAGKKVVVTAGGTHEAIDPVRFVGNSSSGKMGFALAEAARDRGANVVLVSGPSALPDPVAVEIVRVRRAAEMRDAVIAGCADADILIMAAAVADYQPAETVRDKIKRRQSETLSIPLVPTPDILAEVGVRAGLIKVGFAAESQDLLENARQKIEAKHLDLIVANDITASDAGFATDNNRVVILDRGGRKEELPLMPKYDVAWHILDRIVSLLAGKKSQPEA